VAGERVVILILGALASLATIVSAGILVLAVSRLGGFRRRFPTLREWQGPSPDPWPLVSVIVPCRNEGGSVEAAMRSLLAQDYPSLEIVAIDDRSEDATGAILDTLAEKDRRLTVVHVDHLPKGWLGKNSAMHQGAARASGDWLLFTDGDVMFEPDALRKSVAFATDRGLGHFVAFPHFVAEGFLERAFVATFMIAFSTPLDLGSLHRPKTFAFIGVGAFGLVRRDAYLGIGGHERLAYEVGDDVKLGFLLRREGVPQGALDSDRMVRVRWQNGFVATLRGLEKNALAAFEWNWALALLVAAISIFENLAPYLVIALGAPPVMKGFALAIIAFRALAVSIAARKTAGGSGFEGLAMPLTTFLFPCVIGWSTLLTLAQGGIRWRGTFYPIAELRRRCVSVFSIGTDRVVGWTPPDPPRR
jgi:glycosyltransferase involved in cell wall biosynthesis